MSAGQAASFDDRTDAPSAVRADPIVQAASLADHDHGRALFDLLRRKWNEVPAGLVGRVETSKVLDLPDWQLRDYWEGVWHESTSGPAYAVRGWYQEMYRAMFRGKRVLEIGSGCGIDGIEFVRNGATWHFADIVPDNLRLIRRILDAFGLDCAGMTLIEDLRSLDRIPDGFDFVYCQGSMINVPFAFARRETLHLLAHLRPGGRWVELCYPRERWAREGGLPFAAWGKLTDGEATPWVEWYDLERLRARFAPADVTPLVAFNFYNDEFNWFDLRVDAPPARHQVASFVGMEQARRLDIALSPAAFRRHAGASIETVAGADGQSALRVVTPPKIWSYAAHGTLSTQTLQQATAGLPTDQAVPAVEIEVSVQQGRVGLGILSDDLCTFVAQERYVAEGAEPKRLRLPCPPGYPRYHLLLRNTQGGDQASVCTIHRLALTSVRADLPAEALELVAGPAPVVGLTGLVRRHLAAIRADRAAVASFDDRIPVFVRAVGIDALDRALGYAEPSRAIPTDRRRSYRAWTMEADDAPILAYLYRNHRPRRHLEFGTWEGFGATLCATQCDAEIWTLNLPDGERNADGTPAYASVRGDDSRPQDAAPIATDQGAPCFQTDAGPFIGWRYRQAGLAHRVHQILADSRQWDPRDFPPGFFDSVLIDGGHDAAVVVNDTDKALALLRPGGLMLWHDFCPVDGPMADFPATRGVVFGIHQGWRRWAPAFARIFWIRPSYLLVGVKR